MACVALNLAAALPLGPRPELLHTVSVQAPAALRHQPPFQFNARAAPFKTACPVVVQPKVDSVSVMSRARGYAMNANAVPFEVKPPTQMNPNAVLFEVPSIIHPSQSSRYRAPVADIPWGEFTGLRPVPTPIKIPEASERCQFAFGHHTSDADTYMAPFATSFQFNPPCIGSSDEKVDVLQCDSTGVPSEWPSPGRSVTSSAFPSPAGGLESLRCDTPIAPRQLSLEHADSDVLPAPISRETLLQARCFSLEHKLPPGLECSVPHSLKPLRMLPY